MLRAKRWFWKSEKGERLFVRPTSKAGMPNLWDAPFRFTCCYHHPGVCHRWLLSDGTPEPRKFTQVDRVGRDDILVHGAVRTATTAQWRCHPVQDLVEGVLSRRSLQRDQCFSPGLQTPPTRGNSVPLFLKSTGPTATPCFSAPASPSQPPTRVNEAIDSTNPPAFFKALKQIAEVQRTPMPRLPCCLVCHPATTQRIFRSATRLGFNGKHTVL